MEGRGNVATPHILHSRSRGPLIITGTAASKCGPVRPQHHVNASFHVNGTAFRTTSAAHIRLDFDVGMRVCRFEHRNTRCD